MSTKKRASDDATPSKRKKPRLSQTQSDTHQDTEITSILRPDEVDFPRGGGTSLSAVEYKAVKAEALKELRDELVFKESKQAGKKKHSRDEKSRLPPNKKSASKTQKDKTPSVRIERLNHKRVAVGMKVFCQVLAVNPYTLVVSLPNQLLGHIPITQVSTQFTSLLEAADGSSDEDDEESPSSDIPDLRDMFEVGQYLRAVVTAVKPPGTSDTTFGHARDALEKSSRRIELSTVPEYVNEGMTKADLQPGVTISGAVKGLEDHGYTIELGIPDITGFLSFSAIKAPGNDDERLSIGRLVDVVVDKMRPDGRTCALSMNPSLIASSMKKELTSVAALLPGTLVSGLITATASSGLSLQLFGSILGTLDIYQLPKPPTTYKSGDKMRARILYTVPGSAPPQLSLTASTHVLALSVKKREDDEGKPVEEAYPVGTTLSNVTVSRVESERGLLMDIEKGVRGFVHISHASDDHVPSLSPNSGHWKVGSVHDARVIGYHPLDGILQLSLRPSVLSQKFLRVHDVHAGELIKGTVKKLTNTGLFVSISGNVDGVIWPNHYADISLKHPQRRFTPGANVKCRVLVVDPERKRVVLTAKKTLVESSLPIISQLEDVEVGMVTHCVVSKVLDKSVLVEFYNNVKASVPTREASDIPGTSLAEICPVGKPVKVRILTVDRPTGKILASIRQADTPDVAVGDPKTVEIGQLVSGVVSDIHSENVVVSLHPDNVRALISISNLANNRGVPEEELRKSLTRGETLDQLVVVSRNLDKGIVIVAKQPKNGARQRTGVKLSTVSIGDKVSGRVARFSRQGAVLQFPGQITGTLHPTDACDDFEKGTPIPNLNASIEAVVLHVEKNKRHLVLSSRASRVGCDQNHVVVDREVNEVSDLKVDDKVRGFVKSVTDRGLFVSLGRDIDARVQIKELFDDFVKDWKSKFEVNQLVSGRILSIDLEKKQVEMSLRTKNSPKSRVSPATLGDFTVGQKLEGRVKKVEEYGLFISIPDTKISGLCHKSEITDSKDADVVMALRNFREGDPVKAVVISVDHEKNRISFSLKPSHFASDNDDGQSSEIEDDEADEQPDHEDVVMDELKTRDDIEESDSGESSDEGGMDVDDFLATMNSTRSLKPSLNLDPPALITSLNLQTGFQWSNEPTEGDTTDLSEDEGDGDEQDKKKKKKKRKEIEHDLTADLHKKMPESTADFERHLLASPNSSYLWIQYMSFQLQLAEVEKAKDIGRRALQTINIREEQEKLNVWIALLNLENTYGTDESLETVFKDAARHNDSKTVHLRFAAILDESQKTEKAEEQYKRTSKKFGQSSKVWTLFGEHYFKRGDPESARKLLPRSLQSLDKRKHIKTISKFALLEYKLGDPERGRTIYEGIVDSHPKRWDLWQVYIDMEATQKDIQFVRSLFERVLAIKMTSYKAKAFFKKWLELERRIGDEAGAQHVKEKAIEWTQQKASE